MICSEETDEDGGEDLINHLNGISRLLPGISGSGKTYFEESDIFSGKDIDKSLQASTDYAYMPSTSRSAGIKDIKFLHITEANRNTVH